MGPSAGKAEGQGVQRDPGRKEKAEATSGRSRGSRGRAANTAREAMPLATAGMAPRPEGDSLQVEARAQAGMKLWLGVGRSPLGRIHGLNIVSGLSTATSWASDCHQRLSWARRMFSSGFYLLESKSNLPHPTTPW